MKKILSAILSVSVLAAYAAVPVMADYTERDYDIVDVNLTFDDGTVTNDIDGTNAFQAGATEELIFTTSIDTTNEFYVGFDFRFDSNAGLIRLPGSGKAPVGPLITVSEGKLRTQTGKESYQQLGDFTVGEWYRGEIEGRTGLGTQYTTFRLYDKDGALVQETPNFSMRNLSSENRSFEFLYITNVSIDNVLLVQEKPDTITVSSAADEIRAGSNTSLDYVMTRMDKEFNKYAVTWAVYDESNTSPIEDENIVITTGGVLSAGIKSGSQTVTVRATAVFGEMELYGTKQIKINAVDVSGEKFDAITVSGPDIIKAGTSESYTFTATKGGVDVTDTLSDSDVKWSIYNGTGIMENNNVNMTIENGTLTVDASVIPQDITVRASTPSNAVAGSANVKIAWADSQKETVVSYDACETDMTNATLANSWDGSKAYATTGDITYTFGDQQVYTVTDVDIKFDDVDGHGLTLFNSGNENSNIRVHGGQLAQQTGGSKWTVILTASEFNKDAWYHVEFLFLNGSESGYNLYQYDENGDKTLVKTVKDCNRRNDKVYNKIVFTTGLLIDNFKVVQAAADGLTITSPGQYVFAGSTAQFGATATRSGLTIAGTSGIEWSVLDSTDQPIIDGSVSISDSGLVTVDAMASAQDVTVRVSSQSGAYADSKLTIQVAEIFNVKNIGINEEKDKIVKLYVDKNFYYSDDVSFIIAIKSADGRLKAIKVINTFGDRLSLGENEITTDLSLPAGFDASTDLIETFVWTGM